MSPINRSAEHKKRSIQTFLRQRKRGIHLIAKMSAEFMWLPNNFHSIDLFDFILWSFIFT